MNIPRIRVAIAVLFGLSVWAAGYWYAPALESDTALGEQRIPDYDTAAPTPQDSGQRINGKVLYVSACQSCHQPSGQGLGKVFPPLADTDWVTGDTQRLALLVLQGMTGPLTVGAQSYNSFMPGFGSQFSDDQMAAVLNYIRSSWGNEADPISADTIAQARAAIQNRADPWRGEQELHAFLSTLPATSSEGKQP